MKTYKIEESAVINASAEKVYNILADYHDGHPHILPKPAFQSLEVLEGGIGAGTRIRMEMQVYGQINTSEAVVTEPEPGRVLVETIEESGITTTFVVSSDGEDANRSHVTFITEMPSPSGLMAPIQRGVTRRFLSKIYREELQLLNEFAQQQVSE